jgi:fructose-1,6-bisphosphatase I
MDCFNFSDFITIHYHSFHTQGDAAFATGDFIAVFDPLDGSANIDASLPVGTIFGIYRRPHGIGGDIADTKTLHEMFQQDGSQLVAAGYCLFSYVSTTYSVYSSPSMF